MSNKHINLKINKTYLLMAVGAASFFALGNFVSLVDAKSAGGIVIEKEVMDVGSVVFRMDDKNPGTIYGGTWQLITGDATLSLGDGSNLSGIISGNNDPVVPVPEHNHTFTGNPLPNHQHNEGIGVSNVTDHVLRYGYSSWGGTGYRFASYEAGATSPKTSMVSAGTPTGSISNSGVKDVTLNVRGARLELNVWKRIN